MCQQPSGRDKQDTERGLTDCIAAHSIVFSRFVTRKLDLNRPPARSQIAATLVSPPRRYHGPAYGGRSSSPISFTTQAVRAPPDTVLCGRVPETTPTPPTRCVGACRQGVLRGCGSGAGDSRASCARLQKRAVGTETAGSAQMDSCSQPIGNEVSVSAAYAAELADGGSRLRLDYIRDLLSLHAPHQRSHIHQ